MGPSARSPGRRKEGTPVPYVIVKEKAGGVLCTPSPGGEKRTSTSIKSAGVSLIVFHQGKGEVLDR